MRNKCWLSVLEVLIAATVTLAVFVIIFSGTKAVKGQQNEAICMDHFHRIHQALRAYMDDWGTVEPQIGVAAEYWEVGFPPYPSFLYRDRHGNRLSVLNVLEEWWDCPVWVPRTGTQPLTGYAAQLYVGEPTVMGEVALPTRELLRRSGALLPVLLDVHHTGREIHLNLAGSIYVKSQ